MDKKESQMKEVIKEEEILCRTDGFCFGEWGLIYKKERSTSALALEDTDLFVLDQESFNISFSKCLSKAEIDRKNFLLKRITPFAEVPFSKFELIYKTIVPMFLSKNEIIFLENSPSDKIYVIYMGLCNLIKNINILPEEYKNDTSKMKFINLLKIDKGDIIGLETLYSEKYKYTLRSDSDYTVVLAIRVDKLDEPIKDKLKTFFNPLFSKFKDNMKIILDKKKNLAMKTKLNYKSDTILKQIKKLKMNKEEQNQFDEKIQNKVDEIKKISKIVHSNDFKNFKIKKNAKTYEKFVDQTKKLNNEKLIKRLKLNFTNSHKTIKLEKINTITDEVVKNIQERLNTCNTLENINDERNYFLSLLPSEATSPIRSPTIKSNILTTRVNSQTQSQSHFTNNYLKTLDNEVILERLNENKIRNKRFDRKRTVTFLTTDTQASMRDRVNTEEPFSQKNFERVGSLVSYTQENKTNTNNNKIRSHSRPLSSAFFSPTNSILSISKMRRRGVTLEEKKCDEIKSYYTYDQNPIFLSQPVKSNLLGWKKVLTQGSNFNTGMFNMPLIQSLDAEKILRKEE